MNYPSLTEVPNRFESKIAPARPFVNMEKPKAPSSSQESPPAIGQINLARFDLTTFYLVILCAERGSLCEAAKTAHISKSAASHRITALENYLGRKLFRRSHSGLELTEAGQLCLERSRLVVEAVRSLGRQMPDVPVDP